MSKDVDNITASTLFANNADNTGSTDEAENSSHSIPSLECPLPPSCRTISERKDESSSSTSGSSDKSKDYHYIARVQPKYVSCSFEPVAYEEIAMPEENEEYSSKLRKEMIVQKVGLATELDANNSNSMHSSDDTSSSGVLSHRDSTTKCKLETEHHSESIDSIRNDVFNKPDSIKILPGPRLTTSDSFISIDMKHFEDIRRKFILSTEKEFQACLKPSSSRKPTASVIHQKSSEEFDQSSSATPVSLFENEKNKTFTDSNSLDDDIIESVDRGGKNRDKSATGKVKVKKGMELKNSSLLSIPSTVCRICHTNTPNEGLLSPCYCKGSLAYVHLSCLERWLNQSSRNYCELCLYQYNAVETLRYGFFEGVRLWVRHPRNRNHVRSDCLIAFLLTLVTLGLVVICFVGMDYFIIEGVKWGLSKLWTKSFIVSFLTVIMMGYMVTIYLIGKDQFLPWYTWWKNTLNIRLLLSPTVTRTQQI